MGLRGEKMNFEEINNDGPEKAYENSQGEHQKSPIEDNYRI